LGAGNKSDWRIFTVSILFVRKSFITNLFITKSRDFKSFIYRAYRPLFVKSYSWITTDITHNSGVRSIYNQILLLITFDTITLYNYFVAYEVFL